MANQRSRGIDFALFIAIRQLVLHGFPITRMRTSFAAFFSIAWPWPMKILPLIPSKSFRSIPALRGTLPTSSAQFTSAKSFIEIGGGDDVFQERERAIIQFHDHALERLEAGWNFDQVQRDRLVRAKHRARSDAENERITNLSGRSGDRDFNG